jgi:NADPH-dependent glutamate synthase beta subunit-like oxidoreductase
MSFRLLSDEVIDVGLCQGCGLCTGLCKHLELVDRKPALKDYCIMEKEGQACGKCYNSCPQVRQKKYKQQVPLDVVALQTTNDEIKARAVSGGFVTTLNKYLLEQGKVSHLVEVKNAEDRPEGVITTDPNDVISYAGIAYGRSGVLQKLIHVLGEEHKTVGIVGVPCEIRGAADIETSMKANIIKVGLFCNANIGNTQVDEYGMVYSPCRTACPAGVNAAGYVSLIRQHEFEKAVNLVREDNPLPSVCGRICTHECEYNCTLIGTNHPIAVRELKKFITDWEIKNKIPFPPAAHPTGKKVAVIGAGPAGLTAAYYLAKRNYRVTVFEKESKAGGMLRYGVPKFRLPDEVMDHDIEFIKNAGVEIKYNSPIGPNLTLDDLKKQGFEAFFISIGQWLPKSFKLEGENLPNVHMAVDFLMQRKYRHWDFKDEFKGKVIGTMGAGAVAVDVAQTALRLGAAKVIMVDVMTEKSLELVRNDIPENEAKFIEFNYQTGTSKFTQTPEGKLRFNSYKVTGPKFEKVPNSDMNIDVDTIVICVGQTPDYAGIDVATSSLGKIERNRDKVVVDELTMATNIPGVFAGGDIISRGKNVAVAAIAQGRQAAISIDRHLLGVDLAAGRNKNEHMFFKGPLSAPKDVSQKPTLENMTEELVMNFNEIDGVFDEEMAVAEAKRCFNCNNYCSHCQDFAGEYADVTAGEIGSAKGFTTVVIWTERGRKLVDELIKNNLVIQGSVNKDALDLAISKKMQRQLVEFAQTPREKVYKSILTEGSATISKLARELKMSPKDVRYHLLRLVQEKKLEMTIMGDEPTFKLPVEVAET